MHYTFINADDFTGWVSARARRPTGVMSWVFGVFECICNITSLMPFLGHFDPYAH